MVMLAIMVAIYLRINSSISIIFIFLVEIYQNQMLNGIKVLYLDLGNKFFISVNKFTILFN